MTSGASYLFEVNGSITRGTVLSAPVAVDLPVQFQLAQNYPNPFNPSTTIHYVLPVQSAVRLIVYNVLGQSVKELVNAGQDAGSWFMTWNPAAPSGVYFYRILAVPVNDPSKQYAETRKMLLVK